MTSAEIEKRGMNFSGYYNYNPPYYSFCNAQYSYMTIAGNCLNNNSEIYCVILGAYPLQNVTSRIANLTVKGKAIIIVYTYLRLHLPQQ